MREPRVLHVIANLERGGAQELLCTLAECRPAATEILVCTLADGPLRSRLEAGGAPLRVGRGHLEPVEQRLIGVRQGIQHGLAEVVGKRT